MGPRTGLFHVSKAGASALCLLACLIAVLARGALGIQNGGLVGSAFLACFIGLNLNTCSVVVRIFFLVAVVLGVIAAFVGETFSDIRDGLEQMAFLGSLLTALGLLRVVAARDRNFVDAGKYLSAQPPGRRYVSLNMGGHLFTTLLNMGGLGLLIETIMSGLHRSRNEISEAVYNARERRIVSSIMRGFSTIAFWTPFGVALNTLLLIFSDMHWSEIAPFGIGLAVISLAFGWSLDAIERRVWPLFPRPAISTPSASNGRSALIVLVHIVALGSAIVCLDFILPLSFQIVLIMIVPLYGLIWMTARLGHLGPVKLATDFFARAPTFVDEIGVFSLAGLIGPLVIALIPVASLDYVLGIMGSTPVVMALFLTWTTLAVSLIGIHPIISVLVLGELSTGSGVLSDVATSLALLAGWAGAVVLAPMATTAVFVGRLVGKNVLTVTWGWNGIYGVGVTLIYSGFITLGLCSAIF